MTKIETATLCILNATGRSEAIDALNGSKLLAMRWRIRRFAPIFP